MLADFFELLQINDAAFPIGSYTLSWGLETFVQQGLIFDAESAESFLKSEISLNFLTNELLPARLSWEAASSGNWEKVREIDEIYNSGKSAREIREGSKKLALRFLKTVSLWEKSWENEENPLLKAKIRHFSVFYGAYCAVKGISEDESLSAFFYSQISSRIVTAVKLVPLSQNDGQMILHSLFKDFENLLEKVMDFSEKDLCRSCPASEIRAMQHEFLYTRLYMS